VESSTITDEEELAIKKYLPNSVTTGTAKGYSSGFRKWLDYVGSLSSEFNTDIFLENVKDDRERAKRVVLFMVHLNEAKGLRDEQISRTITALVYHFSVEGVSTGFFSSSMISRGRKAGVRSTSEARALEEKRIDSVKLPVFLDLVWKVRDMYWEGRDWLVDGMDSKAIWLAVGLAFDSGPRIGNLTLKDGPEAEDHCIRAGHAAFTIVDPASGAESRIKGGPLMERFLSRQDVEYFMVTSVDLVFMTSKTSKRVKSIVKEPKTIARGSEVESAILDDLLAWIHYSGVQEEDELLTRYCFDKGTRKVVIRKDVSVALKRAADFFGLPEKHFSCKSLRSGFGTHVTANGMSSRDVNKRGGWAEGSTVPEKHYVRKMHSRGAFALSVSESGNQRHGIEEVRRMLPAISKDFCK
jgi:hypothetical protein